VAPIGNGISSLKGEKGLETAQYRGRDYPNLHLLISSSNFIPYDDVLANNKISVCNGRWGVTMKFDFFDFEENLLDKLKSQH
jgi:hypothetical protein